MASFLPPPLNIPLGQGEKKLGKSKIFLWFCLSFVAGVAIGNYLNYLVMAVAAMIFIMLVTVWWEDKRFRVVGFAGLILLAGALRYQTSFPNDDQNFIGRHYGEELELEGVVVREPDVRSDKMNLTLRSITSPNPSSRGGELEGNILLTLGKYPDDQYGDRLKFSGKVEEPFVSEEFSYKDYLARYDTYAVMRFPKVEKLGEGQGSPIKSALLSMKRKFQEVLSAILPEPHNALALGLVLGVKRALPEDLRNALIAVGVSHIIVVSGYNMSIITDNILRTRPYVGRRIAMTISTLTILGFVVMTGAEASVVRAALMAILIVVAINFGRIYISLNALVFVAMLMILQNPKILAFDIGFQLSFMAMAGLIYLGAWFKARLARVPNVLQFRDNLASTLAAQIFVLPLLIFYFERLSLVSIFANVLILWAVPYAMFLTLVSALTGIIFLPLGKIFGAVLWAVLEYQVFIVKLLSRIPYAEVAVGLPATVVILVYFLFFCE